MEGILIERLLIVCKLEFNMSAAVSMYNNLFKRGE
jgi:hypothetical protein